MRLVRGLVVAFAVCTLTAGVAHSQGKAAVQAKVTGKWKVVSAAAEGKPVAMNPRRHKITFTLFPNNGWAMTVLERRRVRAARGKFRQAGPGRFVLAIRTPAGPVDVLTVSKGPSGTAVLAWKAAPVGVGANAAAKARAAAHAKFGAKLGTFSRGRTSIRLTATRGG